MTGDTSAAKLFFFGGTFDPPHQGHYDIVRHVLNLNAASRVLIMPSAASPLRSDERLFSYGERFNLLRRIFTQEIAMGRVILSVLERRLPKPNYTFNTLMALDKICSLKPTIVIGADQAAQLTAWHRASDLIEKYEFLIFARRGSVPENLAFLKAHIVEDFAADISATQIRHSLSSLPVEQRFAAALAGVNPP